MLQDSRVFEMMTLAQDMGVEELRAACEDHVISTLSVDNACTFLTSVMEIHEKAGMLYNYFSARSQKQSYLWIICTYLQEFCVILVRFSVVPTSNSNLRFYYTLNRV